MRCLSVFSLFGPKLVGVLSAVAILSAGRASAQSVLGTVSNLLFPPARVMAAELGDPASLARLAEARSSLPVFSSHRFEQVSSEDRNTGELYVSPFFENGNRDMSNFVCRSLDANYGLITYPLPHYDLPLCPEPYVHGVVLARFAGAGTLSRLWLVTKAGSGGDFASTRFRIYRNGQSAPLVDVPLKEVVDGSNPVFAPPFGMPQTTHAAWYYPVVFTSGLIIAIDQVPQADAVWYQAQVTRDGGHPTSSTALTASRDSARAALTAPAPVAGDRNTVLTLAPSQQSVLFDLAGPATLDAFSLTATSLDALSNVQVRVYWDGASTPAIDLPARELFGAALAAPTVSSQWLTAQQTLEGLRLTLALPMPFSTRARILLDNRGSAPVSVVGAIALANTVPAGAFGELYAQRNETVGPTTNKFHPLVSATGRGRWVGLCVALEGHAWQAIAPLITPEALNFLEGDPTTLVDGVSLRGTGTEDIFDSIFYFQGAPLVTPFVQTWAVDRNLGKASACRWNTHGTELDFGSTLDAKLEIGAGVPALLDRYRTVAFLYR
ncbi:MAG: hypothetical protein JWN48_2568 [Myxococcaceae bacterium]|nr:hypothetical protein [Myxococcaceae bacterium]